ncbi:succinate dehydrogenase assembly factor 2 [Thiothrix litoralis]|jgi:antitoxin CptB|uniref:FAD assembly factor SdhE n=1 Tax=Thiothrix litoralis TaxID=2891210 RepID=A0ABX7WW55_9GAMM|nr:succinate dehydrogenase assembly factor 2 [Thiothrix litoralis]QTR47855.1 succinate dehydrogenase assembly factor 2 [Thiothrix litoralis]
MSELSRLKMRSRRGLKELDVVLQHYLEHHYPSASPTDIQRLDELLDLQDPLLFGMLLGMDPVPEAYTALINTLRQAHD